ncbi:MAG: hypothetical protein QOF37_2116 [Thermoleophilaceae bacterium]|jgi:hypothetical protein|nr:hypothetical protein [Thermoleophilaceae bacterium]
MGDYDRWWTERGKSELRDLLYREWDPIGLKDIAEGSEDEYEAYGGQIARRLRAGATEEDIATLLEGFREEMGLEPAEPPLETARRIREWFRASAPSGS